MSIMLEIFVYKDTEMGGGDKIIYNLHAPGLKFPK